MGYTAGLSRDAAASLWCHHCLLPLHSAYGDQHRDKSDIPGRIAENVDTQPALWVWIALLPAIIGGHIGAKTGSRGVRYVILRD